MAVGVNVGYTQQQGSGSNTVRYRGDNAALGAGGTINDLIFGGLEDYYNSGALSDMLLGGGGFGKSRRYRQYDPYDPNYGYMPARHGGGSAPKTPSTANGGGNGGDGGDGPYPDPRPDPGDGGAYSKAALGESSMANAKGGGSSYAGPLGPGQRPLPGGFDDPSDYGNYYEDPWVGEGPGQNNNWSQNDDAPVEGQGLLGAIQGFGQRTADDDRLQHDLGWQASGDLMDLEGQELGLWNKFGQQNNLEKQSGDAIGWQRSGELSDLEQQGKWGYQNYGKDTGLENEMTGGYRDYAKGTDLENEVGNSWRGVAGPGQYDPLRGDTLEGMVKNPGFSASEKSSLRASQLLPIQSALEAQKLEGNARQAATGNAAGRWGASNAMALNAAGQAAQAGRNVELDSANMMRTDRAQGLSGLGDLQSQVDARKVQGAQGLQNLSGQQRQAGLASLQGLGDVNATQRAARLASTQGINDIAKNQRANQQFGINAGMQLNEQQRNAQAQAAQGVGNLGQRQRANTQWGLGALSDFGKQQTDKQLQGIGLQKDMWDSVNDQGNKAADRAAQLSSLAAGGQNEQGSSGFNAGLSV